MSIQTKALFTWDKNGRTVTLDEPWDGTKPAPRFFLGRTIDGKTLVRFRHDVDSSLIEKLEKLAEDETPASGFDDFPKHKNEYMELLGNEISSGPCWIVQPPSGNKTHYLTASNTGSPEKMPVLITRKNINQFKLESLVKPEKGFEWLKDEIDVAEPCAGLVIDNWLVSQCRSVRRTAQAHEAGLETLADFRGNRYAAIVTIGWAAAVYDLGALPFYTTSWNNVNSQNVAKKLGLHYYGNNFSV